MVFSGFATMLLSFPRSSVRALETRGLDDGGRAQVLVVVSDHGTGSSNFGHSMKRHPCVFDIGEPFGGEYMLWTSAKVPECGTKRHVLAEGMFDADSGRLEHADNPKMTMKLKNVLEGITSSKHDENLDSRSLYKDLKYNMGDYFVRVRDLVCAAVPDTVCPPSDCAITLKLFPQFVDGITIGQRTKDDVPDECDRAQNEKAMKAWKDALVSLQQNPKIATVSLMRDEVDRQFSQFHRFAEEGSEFDCTIARAPTTFASVSKNYTNLQIEIEDCWKGPKAATECLEDAIKLVGLFSTKEMAQYMTGALADRAAQGKLASKSCSTDPLGYFKKGLNDDAQLFDADFNDLNAGPAAPVTSKHSRSEGGTSGGTTNDDEDER